MWKRSAMPFVCGSWSWCGCDRYSRPRGRARTRAAPGCRNTPCPVGEDAQQRHAVLVEEGDHPVVQQLGRADRRLAVVELGEADLRVGVDEGLLVDPPHPLHDAHVEGVLGAAVARMLALEGAMGLLVRLRLLQRRDLVFGEHQAVLAALASSAFSRFFMFSRSWRCQTQRTPPARSTDPASAARSTPAPGPRPAARSQAPPPPLRSPAPHGSSGSASSG